MSFVSGSRSVRRWANRGFSKQVSPAIAERTTLDWEPDTRTTATPLFPRPENQAITV